MARENLDLVLHLGDYIYEYAAEDGRVRKHLGKEIESLVDYRIRHAQYRSDSLVMATFLIGSIMLVIGNLVAEILLAWVDPRVSYE